MPSSRSLSGFVAVAILAVAALTFGALPAGATANKPAKSGKHIPLITPISMPTGHTVPAPGGSISYVRGGNIWLSSPDGSLVRQITTDGTEAIPYDFPSQADNGNIVAVRNSMIYRFD